VSQRTNTGQFKPGQSGNPAGRVSGRTTVRTLLDPKAPHLVRKAIALALAGDTVALRLCLDRIDPPSRQQIEPLEIPGFTKAKSLVEKAQTAVDAVGAGLISPDAGAAVISVIAGAVAIKQDDQLAAEIEALKAAVEKMQSENK
jgi:hypothetical protein